MRPWGTRARDARDRPVSLQLNSPAFCGATKCSLLGLRLTGANPLEIAECDARRGGGARDAPPVASQEPVDVTPLEAGEELVSGARERELLLEALLDPVHHGRRLRRCA